jgi:HEAT repeat protein
MKPGIRRQGARWLGAIGLAVILIAILWWGTGLLDQEPFHDGRSATQWLNAALNSTNRDLPIESAFRAMGTNGVLFLARKLEAKPFQLPKSVVKLIDQIDPPAWADPRRLQEMSEGRVSSERTAAIYVLQALGSESAPALPTLLRLYRQDKIEAHTREVMLPLADQLTALVPEFTADLGKTNASRSFEAIEFLGAIGPKAKPAVPALRAIARDGRPPRDLEAAIALWNIDGEEEPFATCLSNRLRLRDPLQVYDILPRHRLLRCQTLPKSLVPVLEKALRYPDQYVRRDAAFFLEKLDPDRLRAISQDLNAHREQALRDLLTLLQSAKPEDQSNAMLALQMMGPDAAAAVPRLLELATNTAWPRRCSPLACTVLAGLGPKAAAAGPALRALLASHPDWPDWQAGEALLAIDPGATEARAFLAKKYAIADKIAKTWPGSVPDAFAAADCWKFGLTNFPMPQVVSNAMAAGLAHVMQLSLIGPPVKGILPILEAHLDLLNPERNIALAIERVDPEEAKRLGLPGILMICPEQF